MGSDSYLMIQIDKWIPYVVGSGFFINQGIAFRNSCDCVDNGTNVYMGGVGGGNTGYGSLLSVPGTVYPAGGQLFEGNPGRMTSFGGPVAGTSDAWSLLQSNGSCLSRCGCENCYFTGSRATEIIYADFVHTEPVSLAY